MVRPENFLHLGALAAEPAMHQHVSRRQGYRPAMTEGPAVR